MLENLIKLIKKNWHYSVMALLITSFLRYKFGAEFFDIFGIIIFSGCILLGVYGLYLKKKIPDWVYFILIIIGLQGLIVDGVTSFQLIKSWIIR